MAGKPLLDGHRSRGPREREGTISRSRKLFNGQDKEMAMKKHLLPAAAGLLLAGTAVATADTIIITPEQRTVIHDYVATQHVDPYVPEDGVDVSVGTALPDTVELHPIDAPDAQPVYSYVLVDGRTVLVDPQTRRIVDIID
jgi:hypothetical protein